MIANQFQCDVAWVHGGSVSQITNSTPMESLREAYSYWKGDPHDAYWYSPQTFQADFGEYVKIPACQHTGSGRYVTVLAGTNLIDLGGPTFQPQNGKTRIESLSFVNKCRNPDQDDGAFGTWDDLAGACDVSLDDVLIQANDWAFFCWQPGNKFHLTNFAIVTGRVGIANENSGSGSTFLAEHGTIRGDASLSTSIGATSDKLTGGVFGVIARGGYTLLNDVLFDLKNQPQTGLPRPNTFSPRTACVTDRGGQSDVSADSTRIELNNIRWQIDPNGADPSLALVCDFTDQWVRRNCVVDGRRNGGGPAQ